MNPEHNRDTYLGRGEQIRELTAELDQLRTRLAEVEGERDKARREVRSIRAQHARILSWPTQDVARARAVIMQAGARLAREGHELGKAVAEAVDTLEMQSSQLEAELDKLRPVVEAARLMITPVHELDVPWWGYWQPAIPDGPRGEGCFVCWHCGDIGPDNEPDTSVEHDPDCPAIALEQALAALDTGEGE